MIRQMIETRTFDNASELANRLRGLLDAAEAMGHHPSTVYVKVTELTSARAQGRITLIRRSLSDGSIVCDIELEG